MHDIIKGDPRVLMALEGLCAGRDAVKHTEDSFGNAYHWFTLDKPDMIVKAATALHDAGARLAIIAAYASHTDDKRMDNACYEFVLEGVVYSCTVHMDGERPTVPSITPIFANADWHEREMMELYGIKVVGHPDPRRLFLDEELDKGLLGEVVPLSIMMNGASSTDLWERILSDKEGRS